MACHLLRDHRDAFVVTLIERRRDVGPGIAYTTSNPGHVLNVRAANMSAFVDDPDHFWRWLSAEPDIASLCPDPFCFVERRIYGRYMTSLIEAARHEHGRLHVVQGECRSVVERDSNVIVTLADGATHIGRFAVLATGNDAYGWQGEGTFASPWQEMKPPAEDLGKPVLILGTGLTMVDYVVSLVARGYGGSILAMSRRGLLPSVHRRTDPYAIAKGEVPFARSPAYFSHWLRRLVADHVAAGGDWRDVLDALRPFTQEIWWTFSLAARRSFLEHARPWWDVHRHRMAPEANDHLKAIIARGLLRVIAAKAMRTEPVAEGYQVSFRRRGRSEIEQVAVQRIVDCRGIVSDPASSGNPVIRSLIDQGSAKVDPLGIGLGVTSDCAVERADGTPSRHIFAIGPLSRAAFWECIAVPDIRVQCERLARHLRYASR